MGGNEPSDAVRVVNAVLTQVGKISIFIYLTPCITYQAPLIPFLGFFSSTDAATVLSAILFQLVQLVLPHGAISEPSLRRPPTPTPHPPRARALLLFACLLWVVPRCTQCISLCACVNVIIQIDNLRERDNVLILTTSNVSEAIDLAFVDRADIKQ